MPKRHRVTKSLGDAIKVKEMAPSTDSSPILYGYSQIQGVTIRNHSQLRFAPLACARYWH